VVHDLVDVLVEHLLHLGGPISGQPSRCNCLVDMLVGLVLEGRGDICRVLAMCLGDLGQRLTRQLLTQLIGCDANRVGSHL
jgi:hypothetical protein